MKISIWVGILLAIGQISNAQGLEGAWEWKGQDTLGKDTYAVVIFMNGYQVATWYDPVSGEFISTNGGQYSFDGTTITEVVEFHSDNQDRVGDTVSFQVILTENELGIVGRDDALKRLDDGTPGELSGAWLFSGRKRDGEISRRDINLPRKTMKLLSGTRFQWIAYNTATKQFMATGGGTYSTEDGKYTENIEFFSRDSSRVGASLAFEFTLKDGDWHHFGKNSRGEPLYEFWSPRK